MSTLTYRRCEACGDHCGQGERRVRCAKCGKRICAGCREMARIDKGGDYVLLSWCADHGAKPGVPTYT